MPEVMPGDDLLVYVCQALERLSLVLQHGDVLVIAQKIISKAESRYVVLNDVKPSQRAYELAEQAKKDPRLVQLILDESSEVMRVRPGVIIVRHRLGYVHANAGIDRSNLAKYHDERVLLLPVNPDASAQALREQLQTRFCCDLGVVINDSVGRAWRQGTVGLAIGVSGFNPLVDLVGAPDRHGRVMETTQVGLADELAAAASIIMGQSSESIPAVLIRQAPVTLGHYSSKPLLRERTMDLFT